MGTEQKNLDVPVKVTGQTVYGIDVRLPGMKWAAVKSCPVYGGDVKSYNFEAIRQRCRACAPPSSSRFRIRPDPRPHLQRRRRRRSPTSWYQAKTALDRMPIEWDDPAGERGLQHGEYARGAAGLARSARQMRVD